MYFLNKYNKSPSYVSYISHAQLFYAHVTFIMFAFQYLQNSQRAAQFSFGKFYFENIIFILFSFFFFPSRVLKVKLSWNDISLLHSITLEMRMKKGEISERQFIWERVAWEDGMGSDPSWWFNKNTIDYVNCFWKEMFSWSCNLLQILMKILKRSLRRMTATVMHKIIKTQSSQRDCFTKFFIWMLTRNLRVSLNIYHHLSRWHNSANKINELERDSQHFSKC